MIQYDLFWKTLKDAGESTYTLITKHRISSSTINRLCKILNCNIQDIVTYVPDHQEQFK